MKSMTGFDMQKGREVGFYKIRLKTLNHRFLDLNCRILEMSIWEDKITSLVRENISGKSGSKGRI